MPSLILQDTIADTDTFAFSTVSVLVPVVSGGLVQVLAGGSATGTLSTLTLQGGRDMALAQQQTRAAGGGFSEGLSVEMGNATYLLSFDTFARAPRIQDISDPAVPGTMTALRTVSGQVAQVGQMIEIQTAGGDYLIGTGFAGRGLTSYSLQAGGQGPQLAGVQALAPPVKSDGLGITDLDTIQVGATDFLLGITPGTLCSWRVDADGRMTLVDSIAGHEGLWTSGMADLATLEVGGQSFVVVASWESDSLSTVRINPMGVFFPADILHDTRDTRFGGASAVETFEHRGRDFLVAAGDDQGVALLEVLPGGKIHHHQSLEQGLDWNFGAVAALAVTLVGDEAQILITGSARGGIAQLVVDLDTIGARQIGGAADNTLTGGAAGDLLIGGAGDDVLSGGAGDDLLLAGTGSDTLDGGAGADVFVFEADGQSDRIDGFEQGVDRIDLSGWGRIHGIEALTLRGTGNGAVIRWGDEEIRVFGTERGWIAPDSWTEDDFLF